MSLLGIDVGTTGCKALVFSASGQMLASVYAEYEIEQPQPDWAELDAGLVWDKVRDTVRRALTDTRDPVNALAVSSLGEATVPVSADRNVLGPSILNFDARGAEFVNGLRGRLPDMEVYRTTGNTVGNHLGLTKLQWIQKHQRALYDRAYKFLPWSTFVSFMLGADPCVDYSLANRTLLFDLERQEWSQSMLKAAELDEGKLPVVVPAGTPVGTVSPFVAEDLGLPPGVMIVAGAHDQCATAVGAGAIAEGQAAFGMGTYICITPTILRRPDPARMMERGLNTEHHAAPGRYVTFIYNQGGILLKWFRDTFAAAEWQSAAQTGREVYSALIAEMPEGPSEVYVLPHFTATGPPEFVEDSAGVIVGLRLGTSRGEILKGILESAVFYLRESVVELPEVGLGVCEFRAVGGGSRSDRWLQICADIMGQPFARPQLTEAGALGAAIIAGVGSGAFATFEEGVERMVRLERVFEPRPERRADYEGRFAQYRKLWPLMKDYLRDLRGRSG